jgi:catechol 2,3-dioxygenase-like lactoylglutathione lyase family enzyme
MKIEHLAVAANNEEESDEFFIRLLELEKVRVFNVSSNLMSKFFGINDEHKVIRYSNLEVNFEVFITKGKSRAMDVFTHSCLIIENRDKLVKNAKKLQYQVMKVPREGDEKNYYLFLKDKYGNLYEIKSP